jgi:transposase-like protein
LNFKSKAGNTVDLYLKEKRDVNAAKVLLRRVMKSQRIPMKIVLDELDAIRRLNPELAKYKAHTYRAGLVRDHTVERLERSVSYRLLNHHKQFNKAICFSNTVSAIVANPRHPLG